MKRSTKLAIAFTILAYLLIMFLTAIYQPMVKESDLTTTTVTLISYRYEVVGFVPKRHGSRDIHDIIFTASDGELYQIARFYKKEAESLVGHTVTLHYVEGAGSWGDSHAVVELTEGDITHYTLEKWNDSRRNKALIFPLVFLYPVILFGPVYVICEVCGLASRANRRRRHVRKKEAHAEQLAERSNRPRNFPNTTWQTEDGKLTFTVDEQGRATGVIRVPEGDGTRSVPVIFDDTAHTTIRIAPLEAGERVGRYIEIWEGDYDYPDRFTAKPLKTTYFKKGKTIRIERKTP
jgi:hypothetical protein